MQSSPNKRIAVIGVPILPSQSRFNAALSRYAAENRWEFVFSLVASEKAFRLLAQMDCDGALVRLVTPQMDKAAGRLKIPVVNFSSWLANPGVPTVRRDDVARGRLCAEHLLGKGFRRFGIVSMPGGAFIGMRRQGFLSRVVEAGFESGVEEYTLRSNPLQPGERPRFREWLAKLKAPAGLFLPDDEGASMLMDVCREAGHRIPQDLAVIGGACHTEIAMVCVPPLSTIAEDEETVAWRAAENLDALMSGRKLGVQVINIAPRGVIALGSTNTIAVEDREVANAVDFIRSHAATAVNIGDVANHVAISRATLERRFRAVMGVSLHDFLLAERVELAKECLLSSPNLSLDGVARRCGLSTRKNMNVVFRRLLRQRPAAWRRLHLPASAD